MKVLSKTWQKKHTLFLRSDWWCFLPGPLTSRALFMQQQLSFAGKRWGGFSKSSFFPNKRNKLSAVYPSLKPVEGRPSFALTQSQLL